MKKTTGLVVFMLVAAFSFVPFLGNYAQAAPTIKEVKKREATEITLPVKYTNYAGKYVRIKLYKTNLFTGIETISKHNRTLNSDGRVDLRAKDLEPGTPYRFKIKIKRMDGGSGNYSKRSPARDGSTTFWY